MLIHFCLSMGEPCEYLDPYEFVNDENIYRDIDNILSTSFHQLQIWNRRNLGNGSDTLSGFQLFGCGLAAGTCAKLVCHPLDVVKKRFQVMTRT